MDKKIGDILRGQYWVELHGSFTSAELRQLAERIEKMNKDIENGNKG